MAQRPPSTPTDALPYLWTADHAVLVGLISQLESEGRKVADLATIRAAAGLTDREMQLAIARLSRADMIAVRPGRNIDWMILESNSSLGFRDLKPDSYEVSEVNERGLRAAGAWPSEAETFASQLVAALTEAAENEPDPEERSRLRTAASSVAAVGQKTLTEIIASYLAKMSGA